MPYDQRHAVSDNDDRDAAATGEVPTPRPCSNRRGSAHRKAWRDYTFRSSPAAMRLISFMSTRDTMAAIVGIAGAARNAAVALCDGGRIVAVCEQERVTRTRQDRLRPGQIPAEALETVLRLGNRTASDVSTYAIAETAIDLPPNQPVERVDHHRAHAATAHFTSPFADAVVLVCDRHGTPELSVWRGDAAGVTRLEFPWTGPAFATLYAKAAQAFGLAPDGDEHRLEALAHVADGSLEAPPSLMSYQGDRLEVSPQFCESIASLLRADWIPRRSRASRPRCGQRAECDWRQPPRTRERGAAPIRGASPVPCGRAVLQQLLQHAWWHSRASTRTRSFR